MGTALALENNIKGLGDQSALSKYFLSTCEVPGNVRAIEGIVWVMKFKRVFLPFVDPGFLVREGQEIIIPANREGF